MNRREFLKSGTAMAVAFAFPVRPTLILHNGNIFTVDQRQPRAQAIAIYEDRILAVGDNAGILALQGPGTRRVDLAGKTVVPGFIDAHSHPAVAGRLHLRSVDCDLRSIQEIQEAIRARAQKTQPGDWVLGFKYDDTKTKEKRYLTRFDLDAAAPEHPVYISHRGGHTAYVNSKALSLANIDQSTPDPRGGKFERDAESGELTGRLLETATEPFDKLIPSNFSRDEYRKAVQLISRMMSRAGITSVHDAYGTPEDLRSYQDANEAGELSVRVYCLIGSGHISKMNEAGIHTGFGNEWVRVGAMKMTCDGSISERTARLSRPYEGRPDDYGILVSTREELWRASLPAHQAGWQLGIHANGDVAIDTVLGIYEQLQREAPRKDPRFRIEHCTVITPELIQRIKSLNVIPCPFSTYVYYHGEKMKEYGVARLERMFAVRSFLDAGIWVTQSSDYPPGPFEPMMALHSSVTRTDMNGNVWGARQKVSVTDAIRVGTLHGAYASFEENKKGSLEQGKFADLVVLGQDPTNVDVNSLIDVPIERTMAGGKWVYES